MIYIYHITPIENLESILKMNGLLSYNAMRKSRISYKNIAHNNIQDRRATTKVPCGSGGVLHDYVPFYFAPRSPMLFSLNKGNVQGYNQGQNPILHLVSQVEYATEFADLSVVFTDGHATMAYSDFFERLDALDYEIDWDIMKAKYWADTDEDGDRKRRRQAEFLVYQFFPWGVITEIGVINDEIKDKVKQILKKNLNRHQPLVKIHRKWYY